MEPFTGLSEHQNLTCSFLLGCRAGDSCPFLHGPQRPWAHNERPKQPSEDQKVPPKASTKQQTSPTGGPNPLSLGDHPGDPPAGRQYVPPPVPSSRVVSRPSPRNHAANPREFQIQQIKRRFSPVETAEDGGSSFAFQLAPSDPDFPFEMTTLECKLFVPSSFTKGGKPTLKVKNKEMGKGYQINVERGFDGLVEKMPHASLLALMNALDKNLEGFLMERKAETIKIVPNARPTKVMNQEDAARSDPEVPSEAIIKMDPPRSTVEQRKAAQERRDTETRQLEARLGRLPMYARGASGLSYTVPVDPKNHNELPVPLQAVKTIRLIVPELYPLEPCSIEILGVTREAASNTEKAFQRRAIEKAEVNLMGHVNFLAQNMHHFATEPIEEVKAEEPTEPHGRKELPEAQAESEGPHATSDSDRAHIVHVPRPPEWTTYAEEDDTSESDFADSLSEPNGNADSAADLVVTGASSALSGPERGISLNFPGLELHSVELLSLNSLSLTIKCLRCKTTTDVANLTSGNLRSLFCSKCAASMAATYRSELVHANANRAGYLDLDGCTIADMLPSSFIPTCSQCSTSVPSPGVVAVRGDAAAMAICRECHQKLSFKIPETKFLQVSASARRDLPLRRKAPKENLGIIAGTTLPQKGRCKHYAKSYRWFRFSCCNKVYPCDKCHDESDTSGDHPNEHANRMICGYCSREQNYRPEDCGICRMVLIGKSGSGFWEGGKGTRDKVKMNRHDPRKYKRRGGGPPVGGGK